MILVLIDFVDLQEKRRLEAFVNCSKTRSETQSSGSLVHTFTVNSPMKVLKKYKFPWSITGKMNGQLSINHYFLNW